MTWQLQDNLRLNSSLGLLKTKITEHNNSDPNAFNLEDRAAAHAPEYNFASSVQYAISDKLTASIEVEVRISFIIPIHIIISLKPINWSMRA